MKKTKKVAKKKTVKKVTKKKTPKTPKKSYYKKKIKVPIVEDVIIPVVITKQSKTKHIDPPKKPLKTKSTGNYLSKKELMAAVMESKGLGRMSDDLAMKLQLLVSRYARSAQYARYSFNEDMQAFAMMMLVRTWGSFNPERSDNAFSYYTQSCHNSFSQFLNQEKKQRTIRDELLVKQGLAPSHAYQMEFANMINDNKDTFTTAEDIQVDTETSELYQIDENNDSN